MNILDKVIQKIKNTSFHLSLKGYKREEVDLLLNQIITELENQKILSDLANEKVEEYAKKIEELTLQKEKLKYELTRVKSELSKDE
ncbi:DivIVA domain-containing protein [Mycoplasmopsis citelli]|uniref:DivIVA domain n=1 Tax=Mycoplasmopsis citelli TaxID=171281 RepID=A0A449B2B4_9BACT|nr:DivIVA domain-containing protein [Mycoplasmopsis citelli]UUD36226.1 DivIVA domain-containing protein [Mycoplasmopsis citelli]VEU74723.1 DivIVA domain [Mycoplasmopsis citelli]